MAYSYNTSLGDGSTTTFPLTFPYLYKAHIKVEVDGVDTPFTWSTDSVVDVTPAPAVSAVVVVKRVTPLVDPVNDYTNGSILNEQQLDASFLQTLYVTQEAYDAITSALLIDPAGYYDVVNRRLVNVADPVDAQDAVTKTWAETSMTAELSQAITARTAAQLAETNAAASEAASAISETNSGASETNAAASEAAALASQNAAALSETNSAASETAAGLSEAAAAASEAAAGLSETNAAASEAAAGASETAAALSETNAAASELAAAASAAGLPTLVPGTAGYRLKVNATEDGYVHFNETVSAAEPSGGNDDDYWYQI